MCFVARKNAKNNASKYNVFAINCILLFSLASYSFYFGSNNTSYYIPVYTGTMPKARKNPRQVPDIRLVSIGKCLQSIRKRRGVTQKELGEKIGLTREAIASYEAGRSHLIDITLIDLAAALRVSVNEILGQERKSAEAPTSRRWAKRMAMIESLSEPVKKYILRTLDDLIKANT